MCLDFCVTRVKPGEIGPGVGQPHGDAPSARGPCPAIVLGRVSNMGEKRPRAGQRTRANVDRAAASGIDAPCIYGIIAAGIGLSIEDQIPGDGEESFYHVAATAVHHAFRALDC